MCAPPMAARNAFGGVEWGVLVVFLCAAEAVLHPLIHDLSFWEKPHICQKKADMSHGISGPCPLPVAILKTKGLPHDCLQSRRNNIT